MTFDILPLDVKDGLILWVKIAVLFVVGVLIPLMTPRKYVPLDPKNPMEPDPEQTASILSKITYSFLDSIVVLAYRIPHLAHDQLPALADYDHVENFNLKSFKYFSLSGKSKQSHVFWGLMRTFKSDYILAGFLLVLMTPSTFVSPFALNRLLSYLEADYQRATIHPWVWIASLFLGPLATSLFYQSFNFYAARTVVRCEAIITQLVFEHSLRIRLKAETETGEEVMRTNSPTVEAESSNANTTLSTAGTGEGGFSIANEVGVVSTPSERAVGVAPPNEAAPSRDLAKEKRNLKQDDISPRASNMIGHINNLVTTDLGNIVDARDFMFVIVSIPLQIIACIAFLYWILGWSAFVGLFVLICMIPIPGHVAKNIQLVQQRRLKETDARVETVTEAMNMLRMIKLFGWETQMQDKIFEKREDELAWLWKNELLELINNNINYAIPIFVMTVIMKQPLKPSTVFSSMTVFDLLREQFFTGFFMFNRMIAGKVSLDRINDFLGNTELLDACDSITLPPAQTRNEDERIGFSESSFAWSTEFDGSLTPSKRIYLLKIEQELLFKPNCLNIIVGPTGSGKTSMLMALLGEMHYIPIGPNSWFSLPRQDGVAYAAQESWILNQTIKENILFGSPYEQTRYSKVLYQCGLERDLGLFEAGDETEVGEKGLTLSGGQKARITLARAIYSPAQIVLLDDVLAALDVHTAKWIVDKCFSGDLVAGRTVILVTHYIAMVRPLAEFAVSIGSDGKVVAQGVPGLGSGQSVLEALEKNIDEIVTAKEILGTPDVPKPINKLILAEEIEVGHVGWKSVKIFLVALGGNHPALFFVAFIGGLFVSHSTNAFQTWFLGYWASQYECHPASDISVLYYLSAYIGLTVLGMASFMAAFVFLIYAVIRASRLFHHRLVESVFGTTLHWLDITPVSRIVTRCTQDIRVVDGPFKDNLRELTEITIWMVTRIGGIVVMTPVFVIPGLIAGMVGGWVGRIYMAAQISVKREMSNARAPVVGHFGAAIAGLTSVRAYGVQETFISQSMDHINRYTRAARVFYNLNRWVCVRTDAIGGLFAAGLGVYLVYFQTQSTANIGFSLNMAVGFSATILWWIHAFNEFEVQGNSIERIHGYLNIEQEPKSTANSVPPAYWPARGSLVVEKLSAKYSQDGPEVLHDISFEVKSGERVGIIGRTGSGKSTLTLALLRCIPTEGDVFYDGVNITNINLNSLRSEVTIIPQIPELFRGSLRENLDPFNQYDDATLNDALRAAGLTVLQSEIDDERITLETQISSGGGNMSVGQRQILALARAIVRGRKLLILDEGMCSPTSLPYYETDNAIQSSLRHEIGRDTTVITIAHRLQTIMDADKIMVLDAGRIVEYDSPSNLLRFENGFLRSLVEESGEKERLYEMAKRNDTVQQI
ncbi:hypothetical protein AGABI2DRAFT_187296 [Agaricus bisporus var. bisporus H97]|uniref:hypothetical protein n=1 Tax=Agaricus bisporus var. bisporus (strain H97 / ATCC MYA-4626 / FGSC 10389) TaxID=936046 RepID=UPI00029F6F28|nr:hypothetical protein AGABI2DRAFT_187296 [Agaricus bisporus var. bisporus H97]EKV44507.1 hypothetical protein AGABI2DRAFT_187296 [Agaricus bisporus var. bisporus H97]